MTIKEKIIGVLIEQQQERLSNLERIGAPNIMIDSTLELISNLEDGILPINGDKSLLDKEVISVEVKKGNGGKQYVVFNNTIKYFPYARYGRFITE